MHSNIYKELCERNDTKAFIRSHFILKYVAITLAFVGIFLFSTLLNRIDEKLGNMVEMTSEVRESNWIMACDDVSQVDAPVTFEKCNYPQN